MNKFVWILIGLVIGACSALWIMKERAHWLASLEFELNPPPVPASILAKIRDAESQSYESRPPVRNIVEEGQKPFE